jgi:hypothetical protein
MNFARLAVLTAATVLLVSSGAIAAQSSAEAAVRAPIAAAIAAGQSGNVKLLRQQYVPSPTIVDEFAPFRWSGANALDAYFVSYGRMVEMTKMSNSNVTMGSPAYTYVAADSAYVLVPITVTASFHGKPYTQKGTIAFTLQRTGSSWKIATQTFVKSAESFNPY